jgi:fatty-acyl-CoA synthase
MPNDKWGETPCAFVQFNSNNTASEEELAQWCRDNMAAFKIPSKFIFEDIPKTSTGKVQKFILRKRFL